MASGQEISADLQKLPGAVANAGIVNNIWQKYSDDLKRIRTSRFEELPKLPKDTLAEVLIPDDVPISLPDPVKVRAIRTTGNGNCLYNAASLTLVGDESLSLLLRLLTATELYANARFYAEHPKFTEGTGGLEKYRFHPLKGHDTSVHHNRCSNKWNIDRKNADKPLVTVLKSVCEKLDGETQLRMKRLFNTAHFVASENLAFKKFAGLCDLQEKNGLDLGTQYRNDKKCKEFVGSIGSAERERVAKEVEAARFLCVLADGSTDTSITEQMNVYVRYTGLNGRPTTQFAGIVPPQSGDATNVTKAIEEGLANINVGDSDLRAKLVACNFDGASVMMGRKGGVSCKLGEKVGRPLITIHCVAHRLELAVLDAVKKCPYIIKFENVVKSVYKFYYYSPKRRREVNEIATVLQEDHVYYSGVQKTRWLASRFCAIKALEKHFVTTFTHLQQKATSMGDDGARAKGILKEMLTRKFVKFLYFLLDLMKVLSELSQIFQKDELCMTDVVASLETTTMQLEELRQHRGSQYEKFSQRFSEGTGALVCGKGNGHKLQLTGGASNLDEQLSTFISEVVNYLDVRFGNLQREPLSLLRVLDPREMPQDRADLAVYGRTEIRSLVEHFRPFFTEEEGTSIIDQWPMLRTRLSRQRAHNPLDVFSNLLISKPDDVRDCVILLDLMMTLSPTTAKCERGFSAMNQVKSTSRATMSQDTLGTLMRIKTSDGTTKEYDPEPAISHWILDAKTSRHIV